MWFIVVTSSFLWIDHIPFETKEECLYYAKQIESIDLGPKDVKRKPMVVECVKRD